MSQTVMQITRSSGQLTKQYLGVLQISSVKALGATMVGRRKQGMGLRLCTSSLRLIQLAPTYAMISPFTLSGRLIACDSTWISLRSPAFSSFFSFSCSSGFVVAARALQQGRNYPDPSANSHHLRVSRAGPIVRCVSCTAGLNRRRPARLHPGMRFTRGRRRHIETTGHFCPHPACAYHGRVDWGNMGIFAYPLSCPA